MSDQQAPEPLPAKRPVLRNMVIADALLDPGERAGMGLPTADDAPLPVVIELNLQHARGLSGAVSQLEHVWAGAIGGSPPRQTAEIYCSADLTIAQVQSIVAADMTAGPGGAGDLPDLAGLPGPAAH